MHYSVSIALQFPVCFPILPYDLKTNGDRRFHLVDLYINRAIALNPICFADVDSSVCLLYNGKRILPLIQEAYLCQITQTRFVCRRRRSQTADY